MTGRTRWLVFNYGPGVIIAAFGVVALVVRGELWAVAFLFAGLGQVTQTTGSLYLYRSAYFRGRGEQLRDLSRGTWPDPSKMRPNPWDRVGG